MRLGIFAVSLFVFGVSLLIYSLGVSPSVFGGDSGDIVLSYFYRGIPHPPGYPLNTFLGFLLTRLIPGVTFAYRANFVSAIYQALTVGLMFFLLVRMTKNAVISLVTSLSLAFTPLFWLYAHIAEVFQLMLVLVMFHLIFLFEWFEKKKLKWLYISLFFLGLAVFHHQTSLLLVPAFTYLVIKKGRLKIIRESSLKLFAIFLFGFLPYLFLFFTNRNSPTSWDDPRSFGSFLRLLTRSDYGTFLATRQDLNLSLAFKAKQFLWYFLVVRVDFTYFGLFFAITGLIYLFIKKRIWFWFFLINLFLTGPFFLFYASFPLSSTFYSGVSERFLLTNYLFLTILIAFGVLAAVNWISHFAKKRSAIFLSLLSLCFLVFPIALFATNRQKTDLSAFTLGDTLGRDILNAADPPGIIFSLGDTITFNTEYSYFLDRINSQSKLILVGRLGRYSYRQRILKLFPDLIYDDKFKSRGNFLYSDEFGKSIVDNNYGKFPIYTVSVLDLGSEYTWVREGMLYRLYRKDNLPRSDQIAKNIEMKVAKIGFNKEDLSGQYLNFFAEDIKEFYSGIFFSNAYTLLYRNLSQPAIDYFKKGLEINDRDRIGLLGLGNAYSNAGNCRESIETLNRLISMDSSLWQAYEGLGRTYQDCLSDSENAKIYLDKAKETRENSGQKF